MVPRLPEATARGATPQSQQTRAEIRSLQVPEKQQTVSWVHSSCTQPGMRNAGVIFILRLRLANKQAQRVKIAGAHSAKTQPEMQKSSCRAEERWGDE